MNSKHGITPIYQAATRTLAALKATVLGANSKHDAPKLLRCLKDF